MKPVRKTSLWRLDCSTTVAVTIMVTLLIFTSLLCCASLALKAQVAKNYNCNLDTPSLPTTPNHVTKRSLKKGNNTLQLQFKEQQDGMVQFDLCSVITCGSNEKEHEGSEKYICVVPDKMGQHDEEWYPYWYCPSWSYVIANTGPNVWGYHPTKASTGPNPLKTRLALFKTTPRHSCDKGSCNPLTLTLKSPQKSDSGRYILGAYIRGTDPLGFFLINVTSKAQLTNNTTFATSLKIETGFTQENIWLDCVRNAAKLATKEDCIVCSPPSQLY